MIGDSFLGLVISTTTRIPDSAKVRRAEDAHILTRSVCEGKGCRPLRPIGSASAFTGFPLARPAFTRRLGDRPGQELDAEGPNRSGFGLEFQGLIETSECPADVAESLMAFGHVIERGRGGAVKLDRPMEMPQRLARLAEAADDPAQD